MKEFLKLIFSNILFAGVVSSFVNTSHVLGVSALGAASRGEVSGVTDVGVSKGLYEPEGCEKSFNRGASGKNFYLPDVDIAEGSLSERHGNNNTLKSGSNKKIFGTNDASENFGSSNFSLKNNPSLKERATDDTLARDGSKNMLGKCGVNEDSVSDLVAPNTVQGSLHKDYVDVGPLKQHIDDGITKDAFKIVSGAKNGSFSENSAQLSLCANDSSKALQEKEENVKKDGSKGNEKGLNLDFF